ncbi:MAG: MgtC/SapB family protein [Burkholderiales bacterium]
MKEVGEESLSVDADFYEMAVRIIAALMAGALIGYERSYRGRPAGFRTHALVCMASSMLMLITVYEAHWVRAIDESVRLDPTRMAQGIMTGIGFLGAGVIMQEGFSVRGLTTAASIWITAAIGILAGIGFYFPLALSVVLTLGVLSLFRWIEARMPTQAYYLFEVRCSRDGDVSESQIRGVVERGGFSIANFSYRLDAEGRIRRYSMTIASTDRAAAGRLAVTLENAEYIQEFRIAPTGD